MTLVSDLITLALKDVGATGVGQDPDTDDLTDSLRKLNWMLDEWQIQRWLVYRINVLNIVSTGVRAYTIGPGGMIDVPERPDRLYSAFVRLVATGGNLDIDYPLKIIQSYEDYSRISAKGLTSFPNSVYYDPAWPLGGLFPWPIPQAGLYQLFVGVVQQLTAPLALTDNINLPPAYESAIHWNLVERLCSQYQVEPLKTVVAKASNGLRIIRNANTQIAELKMPRGLTGGGRYNPLSDQIT